MRALMVQGTSSWAGKSLVTTALCRHFARRGVRVAPFKAQNMSNNARVVAGGEIGVAQYLQARAARVPPDVRMNPVLIKPEADTRSQVVVNGVVDRALSAVGWRERAPLLWPSIAAALGSLRDEYDLIVLEGAGSPAEINLSGADAANLGAARAADAAVLMVCDIDRGGAFAHLFGTWALMAPDDRARIEGFVLNRFRGDPSLLSPAPEILRERTGVPVVGVVPWLRHELPDEDGAALAPAAADDDGRPVVGLVYYPAASNLDEFKALEQVARLRWIRRPGDLAGLDLVVLPGSKHVTADRAWLRETGLDGALVARARSGLRTLGICGGMQLLGEELRDAGGGEADGPGLGLLPLRTTFSAPKLTAQVEVRLGSLPAPWAALTGVRVQGYEIRQGRTEATAPADEALDDGRGWVRDAVLGISVHGALEEPEVLRRLLGATPARTLDATLDDLADAVTAALDVAAVEAMVGLRGASQPPSSPPGLRDAERPRSDRPGLRASRPGLLVAATHSGAGKTTATGVVLRALRDRGRAVQPFKVGPDFIDAAYHSEAAGRPTINLDVWMMSPDGVRESYERWSSAADVSVIEAMGGLYDGADGTEHGSAAHVAKLLGVPVVVVLDVYGMTRTVAAVLDGLLRFDPDVEIAGCILNRVGSPAHAEMIRQALPERLRRLVIGTIERRPELAIPERYLGLLTVEENPAATTTRDAARRRAGEGLDVARLLRVADRGQDRPPRRPARPSGCASAPVARIAVARDRAFPFYYEENLLLLRAAGFALAPFSPVADPRLPAAVDAVYIGGGYPESFAAELAANRSLAAELRERVAGGMPLHAECGGLMYLSRSLTGSDGVRHAMTGVLPVDVAMDPRHLAIRYVEVRTRAASPLGPAGTTARGQEFHQSRIVAADIEPALYDVTTSTGQTGRDGYLVHGVTASYVHLHFASSPGLVANLRRSAVQARPALRER